MDSNPTRSTGLRAGIFAALAAGFSGLDVMKRLGSGGAQAYTPKPGKRVRSPYTRNRTARLINRRARRLARMERNREIAATYKPPQFYIAKLVRWDRMQKRHVLIDRVNVPIAGTPEIGDAVAVARRHFTRIDDIPEGARIVLARALF